MSYLFSYSHHLFILEMNGNKEDIAVPEECPDVRVEKEDDEGPGSILKRKPTKKKDKVLSKKEQKQKAFEKVLMKTKSITSWLKMPPTVEVQEDVDGIICSAYCAGSGQKGTGGDPG